ncbi:DUF4192 domain-containing protein [Streptomyces specialis]|uniref:DUF4192 domain-containing protein n=1 Tax=Streptomyces specialis TaxID=498367 RepID=UPI00073ED0C0|nr:DUF4192 domain-containing protein [Streptomyces specialis]
MTRHSGSAPELSLSDCRVKLRGPAELADALPYLLGYHPDDSIVLIGLHGPRGRLGGRIRTAIPGNPEEWNATADELAACLVENSEARGDRPEAAVVYLCQAPPGQGRAQDTMERLRPLAQRLRTTCGALEVPVCEALYVTRDRYWSYCCVEPGCCTGEGNELPRAGTSAMAVAAAYAGIEVRGSLTELRRRFAPLDGPAGARQLRALDAAAAVLTPRMLAGPPAAASVRAETTELAERLMGRFRRAPAPADPGDAAADATDDALLTSDDAALLILGLQDRVSRDRAAEWMEGADAEVALRLWRALSRRCVAAYRGHAAAPLTLAGWVAWSSGDEPGAQVALGLALETDPEYVFARLLHQACNDGLDPEPLRRCMRQQRAARRL